MAASWPRPRRRQRRAGEGLEREAQVQVSANWPRRQTSNEPGAAKQPGERGGIGMRRGAADAPPSPGYCHEAVEGGCAPQGGEWALLSKRWVSERTR